MRRQGSVCQGFWRFQEGLMQEIADYSLMYPQLLALYYRYTGNAAALLPYYKTALGMIRHFAQYERADGLLGSGRKVESGRLARKSAG